MFNLTVEFMTVCVSVIPGKRVENTFDFSKLRFLRKLKNESINILYTR